MPNQSEINDDLSQRLDRIESLVIKMIGAVVLVLLLVGWMLPWFDESDPNLRLRLVTSGYYGFFPPGVETRGGASTSDTIFMVVFGTSFVFLDVMTLIAAVLGANDDVAWLEFSAGRESALHPHADLSRRGRPDQPVGSCRGDAAPGIDHHVGTRRTRCECDVLNRTLRALWW